MHLQCPKKQNVSPTQSLMLLKELNTINFGKSTNQAWIDCSNAFKYGKMISGLMPSTHHSKANQFLCSWIVFFFKYFFLFSHLFRHVDSEISAINQEFSKFAANLKKVGKHIAYNWMHFYLIYFVWIPGGQRSLSSN